MLKCCGGATFSADGVYRYSLSRMKNLQAPAVVFIGLNPSTADAYQDDPTVRRCWGYAEDWGYERMYMLNIFAFRATDPKDLKQAAEPIGELNDQFLASIVEPAALVVACWGCHGEYKDRGRQVVETFSLLTELHCLKITKAGYPSHPLYLPKNLRPRHYALHYSHLEAPDAGNLRLPGSDGSFDVSPPLPV